LFIVIKPNLGKNSVVVGAASLSLDLSHLEGHEGDVGGEQEGRQRAVPKHKKNQMIKRQKCT
jgi:hypothetical protein